MKKKKKQVSENAGAGKGDKARNCFSDKYRKNYNEIDWGGKSKKNSGK